jgi:hypothetical protein
MLEMILRFSERPERNAQVACEIAGLVSPEALSNVCWRGTRGASNLIAEAAVSLHVRDGSNREDLIAQRDRKLPRHNIFV